MLESEKKACLDLESQRGDNDAESSRAAAKRKHSEGASGDGDVESAAGNVQRQRQLQATQSCGPLAASFAKATKATLDLESNEVYVCEWHTFQCDQMLHILKEMFRCSHIKRNVLSCSRYSQWLQRASI